MLTSQGREGINGGLRTHNDDSIMYLVPDARHWLHPDRWTQVYTSSTNPRPLVINHKVPSVEANVCTCSNHSCFALGAGVGVTDTDTDADAGAASVAEAEEEAGVAKGMPGMRSFFLFRPLRLFLVRLGGSGWKGASPSPCTSPSCLGAASCCC